MKKIIFAAIINTFVFIPTLSQINETDTVKKYYPDVYTNIRDLALELYADNPDLVKQVINGHSKAFLDIAETTDPVNDNAMTNALLRHSLKGQYAYNKRIIDDISIENPFPYLRCNWYMVLKEYEETKYLIGEKEEKLNVERTSSKDPYYPEKDVGNSREDKQKNLFLGIKVGMGKLLLDNFGEFSQYKTNIYDAYQLSFFLKGKSNLVFFQTEIECKHTKLAVNREFFEGAYSRLTYIGTSFILGLEHQLSRSTSVFYGAGGFFDMRIPTTKMRKIPHNYSYRIDDLNYGFAASLGLEISRIQISLKGLWGMHDISETGINVKTRSLFMSIAYKFFL